jgi:hypothetical protein
VASEVRKERAQHSNLRPLHRSSPDPQARLALKANPVVTGHPVRRALRDQRGLLARREPPALPGRAGSPDRQVRLGRKGPRDPQDQQGIRKHGPFLKGSQALRDQQDPWDPRGQQVLPAHKGRRVWQAIRGRRDLRVCRDREAKLGRPAHPVLSGRLDPRGRKGLSDRWVLPDLRDRKVSPAP